MGSRSDTSGCDAFLAARNRSPLRRQHQPKFDYAVVAKRGPRSLDFKDRINLPFQAHLRTRTDDKRGVVTTLYITA